MEILRKIGSISLNKGHGAAMGLFNLSNSVTNEVSFWFTEETANDLLEMSDDEFLTEARIKFEHANIN
jgi:hypothetical protein